jgi:hypothetical protein
MPCISDPDLFALGFQLPLKDTEWDTNEVLVIPFSIVNALFDILEVTHNDITYSVLDTIIGDSFHGTVHKIVDYIGSLFGQFDKTLGVYISFLMFVNALQSGFFLVVPMVDRFEPLAVQDKRSPISRIKTGCEVIYTTINREIFSSIQYCRWLHLLLVDKFNFKFFAVELWNYANFLKFCCLNILREFELQSSFVWLKRIFELGGKPDKNIAIFDSSRATTHGYDSVFLSLIFWWANPVRIFASIFHFKQSKKRFEVSFDQSESLLGNIGEQHLVVNTGFADVIILAVVQIVIVIKEILSNIVESFVVEPSRIEGQLLDNLKLSFVGDKPILLC